MSEEKSLTYTILILSGVFLAILGAISALLGMGGSVSFEASFYDVKLKTTQTGLIIMIVGALLAGGSALKKPEKIRLYAEVSRPSWSERIIPKVPFISLIISIIGLILLFWSVWM